MKSAQKRGGAHLEGETLATPLDLLERDVELSAVETLIGGPSGRGRLLAVEGPAGIGKTSLLLEARMRGREAGRQVLGARGSELEKTFSFGIVRQLFEPFLFQLTDEERAGLLDGAAGLATPLFEPAQFAAEPLTDASLGMLHGLYWLTANVAARRPLLLVIDDLHCCDPPSLRWLAYVLPRLEELDVVIVVALRPAEPGEDPALVGQILADPLTNVMRPAPLSPLAAAQLVRETLSPDADDAFCARCHEITGGNPLLLRELLNVIATEGLVPRADSVDGLHEVAGRAGWRAVSVRLARLPAEATRLAQAVAILGEDVDPHQAAALADLDEQSASSATADLARVDVLNTQQPPLGFVHPVIRAAVYETLTPLERDEGHARAAHLLSESGAEPERIAAHLLLVPPSLVSSERRQAVTAVLREAARDARCRGASESAVSYLRRALEEAPAPEEQAELLLELGSAETLVNGDAAVEHLREAHELVEDPIVKARSAALLGRQLFFLHRVIESIGVFTRGIEELGSADDELRRVLEAGLVNNAIFEPKHYQDGVERLEGVRRRASLERLEGVRRRASAASLGEKMLLGLLAYHDARAGAPSSVAVPSPAAPSARGRCSRRTTAEARSCAPLSYWRWRTWTKCSRSTRPRSARHTDEVRASRSPPRRSFAARRSCCEATSPTPRLMPVRLAMPRRRGEPCARASPTVPVSLQTR